MKILIADDNPVFQKVLSEMLTQWGYAVVVAADGEQAWEHLQSADAPRLAILDWMMPGMDGVEICRRVRERDGGLYQYLMILTSRTGVHDLVAALEAGADDFVTKPFQSVELRARLRAGCRILGLHDQLQQLQPA